MVASASGRVPAELVPLPVVEGVTVELAPLPVGDAVPGELAPLPELEGVPFELVPLPVDEGPPLEPVPLPVAVGAPFDDEAVGRTAVAGRFGADVGFGATIGGAAVGWGERIGGSGTFGAPPSQSWIEWPSGVGIGGQLKGTFPPVTTNARAEAMMTEGITTIICQYPFSPR